MYKCKHFAIHELLPPHLFNQMGEKGWKLLDPRMLWTLDQLRDRYGSMTVNSYYWGGKREWSGLRTPNSPYYSETSGHTTGTAADVLFARHRSQKVRDDIFENPDDKAFKFITELELGISWFHFSVRNSPKLTTYYP